MKILFFMRSAVYVRNFESTLRFLAERGHEVHVVADPHPLPESNQLVERLCRDNPLIRRSPAPAIPFDAGSFLGFEVRRALDYLRYAEPEFVRAPKLRMRAERNAPAFVITALQRPLVASRAGRWMLGRVLRWCDRAVPHNPAVDAFIEAHNPDVVLVTPLVEPGSPQSEYLRSARALGIPSGLCVYSWDNLTNKGKIHDPLDVVAVWNERMKAEAVTMHGVKADSVVVTGAVPYDHWFTWRPRCARQAFCSRVGLPSDRPYLLYLCSSKFIAPDEVSFVRRWVLELRAGSDMLRDVGVLVRPHPQNADQWKVADLSGLEHVAVWPRAGANPVDDDSRADYYDCIHHSAAAVGVNTSAQIESAIVGRAVYSLLAPEFRETQDGTLHFRHLSDVNGGLLHVAENFPEHVAQLEAAVRGLHDDGRCRRFVEAFVRPHGLEVAAAPRLVAALEAAAARGRRPRDRGPWWRPLVRPVMARVADRLARTDGAREEKAARQERLKQQRNADQAARRVEVRVAKRQAEAKHALRAQEEDARLAAEHLARETAAAHAYEHYPDVRNWARSTREAGNGSAKLLSDAEQTMVAALAHLWDATPDTIANLRRWCEPISGVCANDYEASTPDRRLQLKRELSMLRRQGGRELFVQEPAGLGGFGYQQHGERYNEDTLKFLKVLLALQDGAILGEYRSAAGRRLVWEIGGGWGGFAYQFKTLFPDVTYLITGIPELLLMSAVYLQGLHPDARCRFWDRSCPDELWRDWTVADFIFAPESALPVLRPPRLDLIIDLMALHQMGMQRACAHVQRAFDLGGRYFYSLLPPGDAEAERSIPWQVIEQRYWLHPVPPRREESKAGLADVETKAGSDYAHLVGWKRIRV